MADPIQPTDFLTFEESAEVDAAMMTARDRFSARVAIYSLRSLKQIAQNTGRSIDELSVEQIAQWVEHDTQLQADQGFDPRFKQFFAQLVISSLKPLKQMAAEADLPIENLTVSDVIRWFEKVAKLRIEEGNGT